MTACEKCWRLAGGDPDRYRTLITESANAPCTPEEQAGPDAKRCPTCKRWTVHQHANVCTICGFDATPTVPNSMRDGEPFIFAGVDPGPRTGVAIFSSGVFVKSISKDDK